MSEPNVDRVISRRSLIAVGATASALLMISVGSSRAEAVESSLYYDSDGLPRCVA